MAFFRTELPETIEHIHIRDAVADELRQPLIDVGGEAQMIVRHFKTFQITRIHLIVQRVLACILQDTGHFEGHLPQFHVVCLFVSS
jgi:hypothetical protein